MIWIEPKMTRDLYSEELTTIKNLNYYGHSLNLNSDLNIIDIVFKRTKLIKRINNK